MVKRLSEKVKELRWERQGGKPTRLARRELKRLFDEAGIDDEEE